MKKMILAVCLFLLFVNFGTCSWACTSTQSENDDVIERKESVIPHQPWDMDELLSPPEFRIISEENGVLGILYKSIDYRGKAKDVFAYYSTPGILNGNRESDKNLPAVVCVHGGGGRAFEEWVKIWAKRGYAAISMDLRGYGKNRVELENGFKENEGQKTPYFRANEEQTEDWFYQAVADVVLANSLIRSFPEIDQNRTAITGISWGGIITTLIAGLDDRYKAAVPVYGCGFLYETGSMAPQIKRAGDLAQKRWKEQYDPSLYVAHAKIPMLFVNGTNDGHFFMDQWEKTTELVQNARRSIRLEMKHGHGPGWVSPEIYEFIDFCLGKTDRNNIPEFSQMEIKGNQIECKIENVFSTDRISLLYSTDIEINSDAKWHTMDISLRNKSIQFDLPKSTTMWCVCVCKANDSNYSSQVYFVNQ